jgi:hypothetical protein
MELASATVISCWQSALVMAGRAARVGCAVGCDVADAAVGLPLDGFPAVDVPPGLHALMSNDRQSPTSRMALIR